MFLVNKESGSNTGPGLLNHSKLMLCYVMLNLQNFSAPQKSKKSGKPVYVINYAIARMVVSV